MKKLIALLLITAAFTSCKNDSKTEEIPSMESNSEVVEIAGKFMYFEDSAVFQTKSELYGVIANEKLDDLILQSETLKKEPSDEVAVILKVKKSKRPEAEEGWENRIEIIEIIKVSESNQQNSDIVKLGSPEKVQ